MPAPAPAPAPAYSNISVNFEIEVEGDSALNIFGDQFVTPTNIVVPTIKLPVNALYDAAAKKGLIELVEKSSDPDNIHVKLASTDSSANGGENLTDAWKVTVPILAKGLQRLLCGEIDCVKTAGSIEAVPFNASKYAGKAEYTKQRDFGRLALGVFSHYLIGTVDSPAAISNDVAFVKSMLSLDGAGADLAAVNEVAPGDLAAAGSGVAARYAAWKHAASVALPYDKATWEAGSATDANLARRLVAKILDKGLSGATLVESDVAAAATDKTLLSNIVRQVVGQDAKRLMDEDNSERTKDARVLLRFYPGDIIYMSIKLATPTVTLGAGQAGVTATGLQDKFTNSTDAKVYALKIELGEAEAL
jgi:hypothetical protein